MRHKTSLTSPLFIKMSVISQEGQRSCIYVLNVSILLPSKICCIEFWNCSDRVIYFVNFYYIIYYYTRYPYNIEEEYALTFRHIKYSIHPWIFLCLFVFTRDRNYFIRDRKQCMSPPMS